MQHLRSRIDLEFSGIDEVQVLLAGQRGSRLTCGGWRARTVSDRKNHHYLPRFYLRNFGVGESIALYNLDRRGHVPRASIAGQCQRSYLYGTDGRVERRLGEIEKKAALVIGRLLADRVVFEPMAADHFALAIFVSFQLSRTPQAAQRSINTLQRMEEALAKGLADDMAQRGRLLGPPPASLEDAVLGNLGVARQTAHTMLDLRPKLLVNATDSAFITSDSPLVLLNPWCRGWNATGVLGLMCAGLQIFMPLSPEVVLLLYDEDVYDVDRQEHSSVLVRQPKEVTGINGLQLCSAEHNLYYRNDHTLAANIEGLPWRWRDQRVGKTHVGIYESPDDGSTLVAHHVLQPNVRLDLGFVRVRKAIRHITLAQRARMKRSGARELHKLLGDKDGPRPERPKPGQRWKLVESETK